MSIGGREAPSAGAQPLCPGAAQSLPSALFVLALIEHRLHRLARAVDRVEEVDLGEVERELVERQGVRLEVALVTAPVLVRGHETSASLILRNSTWDPPALRHVSVASGICFPVAQASIRFGAALLIGIVKWRSWNETFPAPPPPPTEPEPVLAAPQLNEKTSISSLWALSVLSPWIPSILRNASNAIRTSYVASFRWKSAVPLPPASRWRWTAT